MAAFAPGDDESSIWTIFGDLAPEEEEILFQELEKERSETTEKLAKIKKFIRNRKENEALQINGDDEISDKLVSGFASIIGNEDAAREILDWGRQIIRDMQQIGEEMKLQEDEPQQVSLTQGKPVQPTNALFSAAGGNLFKDAIGGVNKQSKVGDREPKRAGGGKSRPSHSRSRSRERAVEKPAIQLKRRRSDSEDRQVASDKVSDISDQGVGNNRSGQANGTTVTKRFRPADEDSGQDAPPPAEHVSKKEKKTKKQDNAGKREKPAKEKRNKDKKEKKAKKEKKSTTNRIEEAIVQPILQQPVESPPAPPQTHVMHLGNGTYMPIAPGQVVMAPEQVQYAVSAAAAPRMISAQPGIAPGSLGYVEPTIIPTTTSSSSGHGKGYGKGGKWRLKKWKASREDIIVRETKELQSKETKKLREGEIVEQTGPEVQVEIQGQTRGFVTRMPITHPAAKNYPEAIGWVTLSAKQLGGPEYFVEGPSTVTMNPGKGKKPSKPAWTAPPWQSAKSWGAPAKSTWGKGKKAAPTYNKGGPKGNLTWSASNNTTSTAAAPAA
ncbi:unnamed protein product [Amoebophrya sp. A120]|nr:unnamed protein product [Amoebophrya sp. A120]|eukprot:GSA120T00024593001.1